MENTPTNVQGIISQQTAKPKTPKPKTPAQLMRSIVNAEASQALLKDSLKENAGAFAASIIDLYSSDNYLQKCNPKSVFAEVLKAVSLKLPINKQLGFAYIIPYYDKNNGCFMPTFQLGYKGYIQLCMRTGAYRYINAGPVLEGELVRVDKLSGAVDLSGEATGDTVIGYFAYMETLNGFRKCLYWSREKLIQHVSRYSDSYKNGNKIWKENFEEMAIKTVLKYMLSHWGVMSTEMEQAFQAENTEAADAMLNSEPEAPVIPAEGEEIPESEAVEDAE